MKKIFILSLFVIIFASGCTLGQQKVSIKEIGIEEAKTKSLDFINNYLMGSGQTVTIKEVTEENGLYRAVVTMADGQEINSYLSKDGEAFYPSGMNIKEFIAKADENKDTTAKAPVETPEASLADIKKNEKPKVELFVMSHCPYGTQIEKGILPALKELGKSVDFELKFCDYAMHGEKELKEQMSQYCIQKNNPDKIQEYLNCFLADETKGAECIAQLGINKAKIDTCVSATDSEYKVMASFQDKSTWKSGSYPQFAIYEADNTKYSVTGSPSLVVNGTKVQAGRDSASLLKTICAGFTKEPDACKVALASEAPAPGFGFSGTSAGGNASCGN